ncbi:MAG: EAL domain-containing protein [Myxococcales bacterium]|nr:EAL domain-containing protein [Myxococcales bacterium]
MLRDSDLERRRVLATLLRAEGATVLETDCSASAIACLEQDTVSLVMAVASSSDTDAFSLSSMISGRIAWDTPPVLIILDREDAHVCDVAHHTGAADLIMLPCTGAWLISRVRHHLMLAKTLRNLRRSQIAHAHAERLARIGSWEWDTDSNEMSWSDETYRVLGFEPGEVEMSHTTFWQSVHPDDRKEVLEYAGDALDTAKSYRVEHRILLPDGKVRHVQQQGKLMVGDGRQGRWIVGTIQDITQQRLDQEKIRYLANYDSLTGLANRHLFSERLKQAIETARLEGRRLALLYMDLDNFKRVNDAYGHSAGDQLLRHVANLLRARTRGDDLVARPEHRRNLADVSRLGGDEFMVLISDVNEANDAGEVAGRILEVLSEVIEIEGHHVSALGSIGIALFPEDGDDGESLMSNADTAMYHAKECGRNTYKFYCHSMNEAAQRRLLIASRLRIAMERNEIEVHYQPKLNLATGEIYGMEALARWNDPELGGVSPKEFISLAEETGLIIPLGNHIMAIACRDTENLVREHGLNLICSVNVSTIQFTRDDFLNVVGNALQVSGLDPNLLELEITESLVLQDDEDTALMMRDIKAMGVSISLDDFGTGYSALSYLPRFPLNSIKLDRCFVRDIDSDPAAAGVAAAVISLAHSLGLEVVAEGVDAEDQRGILTEWGCDALQGFLISAALPIDEFLRFIVEFKADNEKPDA